MNTALWIIQILLSIIMLAVGYMKTFYPVTKLNKFSWTTHSSKGFIRFVGISELLIGIGLILPQLTGVCPVLTPYAALSLCMVMVLAIVEHIRYNEAKQIWTNVFIIFLSAFVALGRFAY
ncbi:MAG: DoxX family protein [Bacteroidetes bacterium]|nr:MAG: DoxX family protein [Bacteroidota bacterium]